MELIIRSNDMQEVEGISAEYPYVLNRADSKETRVPWHWHEELEFSYVIRGTLKISIPGHTFSFQENEGFFINTNILHAMEAGDPQEGVFWHSYMFHPVFLGGQYKSIFESKYLSPVLTNRNCEVVAFRDENETQTAILELLRQASRLENIPNSEFQIRNVFSEIWLKLMQELSDLERSARLEKPVSQERIRLMLAFIHRHYNEKLTLEQIAAAAIISPREALRCFQSCIRKTPFEYLMDYRVQMAEKLLRTSDLNMTEIAVQTGFSNSAYFAKTFRELRGLSPSQYRKAK